jgi:spore germination protein GerM
MKLSGKIYLIPPVVLSCACVLLTSCANRTSLSDGNPPLVGNSSATAGGGTSLTNPVNGSLHVWFVKPNQDQLQLVSVDRANIGDEPLTGAVKQLLDGPNAEEGKLGLASEIPRGTILLGVKKVGNDFELNLSHRFAVNAGASSMETRIAQVSKTVAAVAGSHKVYLAIEGQRLTETPGDGLEVKQPLN